MPDLQITSKNVILYQKAKDAIEKLFSDTSVSVEKAKENLELLRDEIDLYLESL